MASRLGKDLINIIMASICSYPLTGQCRFYGPISSLKGKINSQDMLGLVDGWSKVRATVSALIYPNGPSGSKVMILQSQKTIQFQGVAIFLRLLSIA